MNFEKGYSGLHQQKEWYSSVR